MTVTELRRELERLEAEGKGSFIVEVEYSELSFETLTNLTLTTSDNVVRNSTDTGWIRQLLFTTIR